MMGIAFWMGLLWRPATAAGAWAATLTGFTIWGLTSGAIDKILGALHSLVSKTGIVDPLTETETWNLKGHIVDWLSRLPYAESLGFIWQETDKAPSVYEPWEIVFYMVGALAAGIVVSLLTKPVDNEKLDRFYTLTRTPIEEGEVLTEPCKLPEGVTPSDRPMLCTAFGLEIPMPSRTSVVGFLAGWVAVAALIGGFVWLVS